jgi:hypothetical protein
MYVFHIVMQMMITVCASWCVCVVAWTAYGSARRRSARRHRSTRTSARGTPLAWSTCPGYAPFRPARLRGANALGRCSMRRGRVCGDTADVRARVCARARAHAYVLVHKWMSVCSHSNAYTKIYHCVFIVSCPHEIVYYVNDSATALHVCAYPYTYIHTHIYLHIYSHTRMVSTLV